MRKGGRHDNDGNEDDKRGNGCSPRNAKKTSLTDVNTKNKQE
jgi:hypothetical protein